MKLFDYGIQNERSHIRAHVCPATRLIYVYKTEMGLKAIESGKYRAVSGYQKGVEYPTSEGFLVPPNCIDDIRILKWESVKWWNEFSQTDSTTEKGNKAVKIINELLRKGRFPIWADPQNVDDLNLQIQGTDILIYGKWRIQVKCDFRGGPQNLGGSGYLFLQVKECNPLKKH